MLTLGVTAGRPVEIGARSDPSAGKGSKKNSSVKGKEKTGLAKEGVSKKTLNHPEACQIDRGWGVKEGGLRHQ